MEGVPANRGAAAAVSSVLHDAGKMDREIASVNGVVDA